MSAISWTDFLFEAQEMASREYLLSFVINDCITSSNSFAEAIAKLISLSFGGVVPVNVWREIFLHVTNGSNGKYSLTKTRAAQCTCIFEGTISCCCAASVNIGEEMADMMLYDLKAIKDRDPACANYVTAFLNFKGFKALQSHRIAHILWYTGRKEIALAVQSRCAELWSVDIHPAAIIGSGLMIDHGTGVVIGETAVVGRNCSFLHGVTLGSTGKDKGERHPKLSDDILVGCNAIILGNITIGRSAKIGSGSVVIKSIPNNVTVVGNPARIVGRTGDASAAASMDLGLKNVVAPCGKLFRNTWALWANGSFVFEDIDSERNGFITKEDLHRTLTQKFNFKPSETCMKYIFDRFDVDKDGLVSRSDFDATINSLTKDIENMQAGPDGQMSPRECDVGVCEKPGTAPESASNDVDMDSSSSENKSYEGPASSSVPSKIFSDLIEKLSYNVMEGDSI